MSPRGRLAQLVEHLPYKQEVACSSQAPPTEVWPVNTVVFESAGSVRQSPTSPMEAWRKSLSAQSFLVPATCSNPEFKHLAASRGWMPVKRQVPRPRRQPIWKSAAIRSRVRAPRQDEGRDRQPGTTCRPPRQRHQRARWGDCLVAAGIARPLRAPGRMRSCVRVTISAMPGFGVDRCGVPGGANAGVRGLSRIPPLRPGFR
jgi:hypothetical protein